MVFNYFFQKSLFTENYFLIDAINSATQGPLYTCLVLYIFRDIAAAARAAVNGDESALDMFSWQKSGGPKLSLGVAESIQLFFGTKDGEF